MVTKTFHPGDPQIRSPEAKAALDSELSRLRKIHTWDESVVLERGEAKRRYPNAHFACIFAIFGIKHYELDQKFHKWKARVVFGGDNIKTADGDFAIFSDVGTTPSNMVSARAAMAISCMIPGMRRLQSDCIQAFTPAPMDPNLPTYISLPRVWWPQSWIDKGMKDPVCPLRLALYGHPKSGDLWHKKLEDVLLKNGFETMADWPSLYFRRAEGDLQIIIVSVSYTHLTLPTKRIV